MPQFPLSPNSNSFSYSSEVSEKWIFTQWVKSPGIRSFFLEKMGTVAKNRAYLKILQI